MAENRISEANRSEAKTSEDRGSQLASSTPTMDNVRPADLMTTAADPALVEDVALALLKRSDLHHEVLEQLARNANALKIRKVKLALISHPNTPRHVSVPLARQLYTFDLMKVALSPLMPADVKIAVDDVLISRLKAVTLGERLTLARRASGRVAAALLQGGEPSKKKILAGKIRKSDAMQMRVIQTALENPRLTEALVISSVLRPNAIADVVQAVAHHPKWSSRREIRTALLRTEHLSLARALEFAQQLPAAFLNELLASSRLPDKIKDQLLRENQKNNGMRHDRSLERHG
jgi:hypothetical protein